MPTVAELGQKVKAKYPGQYDDMADADVGAKVKAKYPSDYADFADVPKDRIQAGVEAFDKTKAAFESQPRQSMLDSAAEAAKGLGGAITGAVTGIPDALSAVGNFVRNPSEWARKHFDPSQANAGPGEMGVNPVAEAQGAAVAAALPGAVEGAGNIARAGGRAVARGAKTVLQTPGAPALIEGVPEVAGGATMLAHGNPYGLLVGGRGISRTIEGIRDLKASRVKAPAEVTPAPAVEAAQPAPSPVAPAPSPAEAVSTPPAPAATMEAMPETPATAKKLGPGATDAKALSDKLSQWRMTPDEAQAMNEKGWIKLAFDSGVKLPSKAVRKNAIFNLIKEQAGPAVTPQELFERFKAAGK